MTGCLVRIGTAPILLGLYFLSFIVFRDGLEPL